MKDKNRLNVATTITQEISSYLKKETKKTQKVFTKNHNPVNFATKTDLTANKIAVERIKRYFPQDSIISEELPPADGSSKYCWIIDPIDGTNAFVRSLPHFTVAIGILKDNDPYLGVISAPLLNLVGKAQVGKGCFVNGRIAGVSSNNKLIKAHLATDYGYGNRVKNARRSLEKVVNLSRYTFSYGCTSLALLYLAQGKLDGYVHAELKVWDLAPAVPLVEEAGGVISDFSGNLIDWSKENQPNIVASNKKIHSELISKLS